MNFAKQLVNQLDNAKQRGETHIVVNGVRHSVKVLESIGSALTTEQRQSRNTRIGEHIAGTDWAAEFKAAVEINIQKGMTKRDATKAVDPLVRERWIKQANEQQRAKDAESNRRAAAGRKRTR